MKQIAEQYAVDCPSHSPPSAWSADDGACFGPSTSATFDQGNAEPVSSFSSAVAQAHHRHVLLTIITDGIRTEFPVTISLLASRPLALSLLLASFTMGLVSSQI